MGLSTGRDQATRARRDVYRGVCSQHLQNAFLDAMKAKAGIEVSVPDIQSKTVEGQTSTATVIFGGPCRLYGVRVTSGDAVSSAQADASLAVIVNLLDSTVGVARTKCAANKDAEAYFFAGTDGIGIPIATSLSVSALAAADGSSNPAAGDRPTITVFYGA